LLYRNEAIHIVDPTRERYNLAMMPPVEIASDIRASRNAAKFRTLRDLWYRETGMLSLIRQKALHPAYQQIIGMGREALPFIFDEMRKQKGDWYWALESITDVEERPERHSSPEAAREAWLEWAKVRGY
jgi:hypothetical protein